VSSYRVEAPSVTRSQGVVGGGLGREDDAPRAGVVGCRAFAVVR
jgi:hypothetical protein